MPVVIVVVPERRWFVDDDEAGGIWHPTFLFSRKVRDGVVARKLSVIAPQRGVQPIAATQCIEVTRLPVTVVIPKIEIALVLTLIGRTMENSGLADISIERPIRRWRHEEIVCIGIDSAEAQGIILERARLAKLIAVACG